MLAGIQAIRPGEWSIGENEVNDSPRVPVQGPSPTVQPAHLVERPFDPVTSQAISTVHTGYLSGSAPAPLRRRRVTGGPLAIAIGALGLTIVASLVLSARKDVRDRRGEVALRLESDPDNCGLPNKSCEGGACVAGKCQPVALINHANAPRLFLPRQIAIDTRFLYLADYSDYNDSGNPGEIYKVPLPGGPVTLLAEGNEGPFGIATDGIHVYWGNYDGGAILRVAVDGGAREVLATGQRHPNFLALDGDFVYWSNFYAGDTRKTADRTGQIVRMRKAGGPTQILADNQDFPNGIVVSQGSVYWVNYANNHMGHGSVMEAPSGGGAATVLSTDEVHPFGLIVDADTLYWTNLSATQGAVKKLRLTEHGAARLFDAEATTSPTLIASQGERLYWTERETNRVVARAKAGGDKSVIATDQIEAYGIAADEKRVYWVMRDGVMKVVR
jgi:sugar lactone lactonase YvrE